tara:strand:- start:1308 stop:1826 length:519 start_codon:yes stop_codon:yes gene_type:complete
MKIKFFSFFLLTIFLTIFFIFYKGLENTNIYTPNVDIKKDIPLLKAKVFGTDNMISFDEIFKDDKFYLMNIWSSWCIPCRDEHPFLLNLKSQKNLEIIGLNYKDNNENAKKFLKELNSPYKVILSDKDGLIAIEWGAYGVPETFIIYNKKIIKKYIGPLNSNSLLEIIKIIE